MPASFTLTTVANIPTLTIASGNKKPVAYQASLAGAALAAGKVGTIARAASKKSLPEQAKSGGFHTFAGLIAATFPKAAIQFDTAVRATLDAYTALHAQETDEAVRTVLERKIGAMARVSSPHCREGFSTLVQIVLNQTAQNVAKPMKLSVAQRDVLALVIEYVALMAAPEPTPEPPPAA